MGIRVFCKFCKGEVAIAGPSFVLGGPYNVEMFLPPDEAKTPIAEHQFSAWKRAGLLNCIRCGMQLVISGELLTEFGIVRAGQKNISMDECYVHESGNFRGMLKKVVYSEEPDLPAGHKPMHTYRGKAKKAETEAPPAEIVLPKVAEKPVEIATVDAKGEVDAYNHKSYVPPADVPDDVRQGMLRMKSQFEQDAKLVDSEAQQERQEIDAVLADPKLKAARDEMFQQIEAERKAAQKSLDNSAESERATREVPNVKATKGQHDPEMEKLIVKSYGCPDCGKEFDNEMSMKRHHNFVHVVLANKKKKGKE